MTEEEKKTLSDKLQEQTLKILRKNMEQAMIGFGLPSEPGKENNFTDSNGWNRRFWTEKNRKSYSARISKAQSYYRDLAEKAK